MSNTGERKRPVLLQGGARRQDAEALGGPLEMAAYIAEITLEMRNMARDANLPFLAYLLEMVFQEAFDVSQGDAPRTH